MKGRNAQVSRIYMLLNILEGAPHGLSTRDIHSRLVERGFEVEIRTVYRDLDALRTAGFPLDEKGKNDDNAARWTLERTAKATHFLALDSRELLGLYLARAMLTPLQETPFYSDLKSAFEKISEKLAKQSQLYLDDLQDEVVFEPGQRWGVGLAPEIVETVRAACGERQQLRITYRGTGDAAATPRTIGPHFLYFAKGSLYLVGEDLTSGQLKTYSVPRIESAELSDDAYDKDQIDPVRYFANSFGIFRSDQPVTVRLLFQEVVAPFVRERRWHDSQSLTEAGAGKVELRMQVGITPDLVQWILGFGANVKVMAPDDLVRQVSAEARKVAGMYQVKGAHA